ncbi:helix-turn-helix domain-containing protein [Streptomyces luteogriseus]|uniref:helix-turn-helix domain-containing protein n=1 Tax=Streptomyces luteogriseus TaxID=68233 RepID=UPI0037B4ED6C
MGVPVKTSRKALLARGWYVVADVQTAFLGLSGKAHDLLIIIKHFQGDNTAATPTQKHLAAITGWSLKTVERTVNELTTKGALTSRRTGRANRLAAVQILGTPDEIRILMGADVEIPSELVASDPTTDDGSDTSSRDGSSSYKEPLQNEDQEPLPTGGGDAAAPQAELSPEDEMSINGRQPHDNLDPATSLGLWESQESPETASDSFEGLFPAEEVAQPAERRQRGRSQAQMDSAGALAIEFEQLVRQQPWAGPAPVNRGALARNLSQWRRDGLTADTIRAMMQRYAAADFSRKPGKAPWTDFIAQRHRLLTASAKAQEARAMEEHRSDDAYWLGSMAGGQ